MPNASANAPFSESAGTRAFQIVPSPADSTRCVTLDQVHEGSAFPVTARCWQAMHHGALHNNKTAPLTDNPAWWVDCVQNGSTLVACALVRPDLPCFAGHFPGQPILPGVIQLQWAVELAAQTWPDKHGSSQLAGVARLKFKAPIAPGDTVQLRLHTKQRSVSVSLDGDAGQLTSATLNYRDTND